VERTAEDGFVTLRELRDLALGAELVALSACETNAGTLRPLEGVAGLSRAALAAGAQSVLSTLWQVEDEEAAELIADFYREWLAAGRTRRSALAAAKRAAIDRGAPLSTWSAYTLWDAGE
jgi:CHAT domain-containing protein